MTCHEIRWVDECMKWIGEWLNEWITWKNIDMTERANELMHEWNDMKWNEMKWNETSERINEWSEWVNEHMNGINDMN